MAYTPVPQVATGDYWSAISHNIFVRDNFAAGVPAVMSGKGSLAVGHGEFQNVARELKSSANGDFLEADPSNSYGMRWTNVGPGFFVEDDGQISISPDTVSVVSFDSDPQYLYGLEYSRNSTVTVPDEIAEGVFEIECGGFFTYVNSSSNDLCQVGIERVSISGSVTYFWSTRVFPPVAVAVWCNMNFIFRCIAGEQYKMVVLQTGQGTSNFYKPRMSMMMLR